MNEWTVSWVIWRRFPGLAAEWLDFHKARRKAAGVLNAIRAISDDNELADRFLEDEQRRLGGYWKSLSDLRNGYNHHGMRHRDLGNASEIRQERDNILDYWRKHLRQLPDFLPVIGAEAGGLVLVSPIGQRPGVLYSALEASRNESDGAGPTVCLVICSEETERFIDAAADRAGYAGRLSGFVLRIRLMAGTRLKESRARPRNTSLAQIRSS